ncbi:MAG: hypothetical protein QM503_13230 [Bacteroidota bacterium]
MNNSNKNIDNIVREKFESFTPTPPKHVWVAIEQGLVDKPVIAFHKNRWFIAASILALIALISALFVFNPLSKNITYSSSSTGPVIIESTSNTYDKGNKNLNQKIVEESVIVDIQSNTVSNENSTLETSNNTEETNVVDKEVPPELIEPQLLETDFAELKPIEDPIITEVFVIDDNIQHEEISNGLNFIKMKKSGIIASNSHNNEYTPETRDGVVSIPNLEVLQTQNTNVNSYWKVGSYLSPELAISNFDSVEILNSYTVSIEPTYFINKHWFVRSGVGLSYVRDRGFAKINYITNDYMGSYDDVYDITFDTIQGNITPVYHTKTVEIWDSVHHVTVSNVTNKYIYLQVPLLVGYYHKKMGSNIGWYIMGGPAFNFKLSSWIDDPLPEDKDADIISLQNNLPVRSNNYLQLWLGAGVEYQVNKNISIAVEPGFRYYFKSIYSSPYNATSSTGVTLRIGLIYIIK